MGVVGKIEYKNVAILILPYLWGPWDGKGYKATLISSPAVGSLRWQGLRSHVDFLPSLSGAWCVRKPC